MRTYHNQKTSDKQQITSSQRPETSNQLPETSNQQLETSNKTLPCPTSQQRQEAIIQSSPYITKQKKQLENSFGPAQKKENKTGMPDELKTKMESSFNTDFSDVKVHANSSKAPEVGALAYTQGSDVHFAPGQFNPNSSNGQSLIGHELAHVVQQREGRVKPTTEVAGMPVNDNPKLEDEADALGVKAGR